MLVQFADDAKFTLARNERSLAACVALLDLFWLASGFKTNEEKTICYRFSREAALDWTYNFTYQWAVPGNIAKLLGMPFGIDPLVTDNDEFLFQKNS